uniref:DUF6534 domain-containing protein n=1 Tax=Kwoniella dejecticola CBS 10117 TaxID=1296121 RepID=A0A1A6A932_9TREE|nr:uncharacterized protein I303_02570 [Kwoniella dejecticola CBS 10117]OBR86562.1 hypothetical protein I303_02570 [Kwoniella dejecticola CBS 10117]
MSMITVGNTLVWGDPTCGGPHFLQLASNDTSTDAVEEGLKAILKPHTGLYLGPVMIGYIADMVLFGVMIVQMGKWLSYATEDRWFIKIIVGWCALFGTIASVFNLAYVHHLFVNNFGTYGTFASADWSSWLGIIAPLTSAGVQTFYCDRAYKLSGKNMFLGSIIMLFIITSVVGGIGSKITSVTTTEASTGGAMAADFIITTSIMWCLSRSKSGFIQTDQLVNKLLAISAETQLPPTLMAISFLIIFAYKTTKANAHPGEMVIDVTSNLTGFFMMTMPKTYVVGFLAVLNSRVSLKVVMSSKDASSHNWKANTYQLRTRPIANVKVTTETYVQADKYDPKTRRVAREAGYTTNTIPEESDIDLESLEKDSYFTTPHTSKTGLTLDEALRDSRV